ncbi:MAG: SRPBCC family protein [Planctomycetes bacterium]|nr:SRPBCC family protein [Planctomycetota bacterium]
MLLYILLGVAAVIVLFLVIVAMQPADFRVTRSATIAAAPAAVFDEINDFHRWEAWSPWAKLDPQATNTFEGPSAGKGAMFAWSGNKKVGAGKMTILDSRPAELVRIKLEFLRPFAATNTAEFTFTPERSGTVISWSMTGTKNFMSKAFCLFANMDKMVGGDFEKGLAQIKKIAETKK